MVACEVCESPTVQEEGAKGFLRVRDFNGDNNVYICCYQCLYDWLIMRVVGDEADTLGDVTDDSPMEPEKSESETSKAKPRGRPKKKDAGPVNNDNEAKDAVSDKND